MIIYRNDPDTYKMEQPKSDTITIETEFKASVKDVWHAWTNPGSILNWFGSDPNGKGVKAELDVRPGGSFEITFQDSDQTEHICYGVYKEIQEFSRLHFSWTWKSEPGIESLVTVRLIPTFRGTRMLFEHANVGTGSRHNYLAGWRSTFEKLERMLARQDRGD